MFNVMQAGPRAGQGPFLPFSMRCNLFFLAWPDLTVSFSFFGEGDIPTKLHLQLISIFNGQVKITPAEAVAQKPPDLDNDNGEIS